METCLVCEKRTTDDIHALPAKSYDKKSVLALGLMFPMKYWQCEHCKAIYAADRKGNYKLYVGELPETYKELINAQ